MIAQLNGIIANITERTVVLDVHGVGYEVQVTRDLIAKHKVGAILTLFTHHVVREDTDDLFGFESSETRDFFKLLITVSGIGPKSGLNILDAATPNDISRAVMNQDAGTLTAVNGIGKKTAEKIVVELKDKIAGVLSSVISSDDVAVLEAIVGLGYSASEVREALKQVAGHGGTLADKVRVVLKALSRG